MFDFIKGLIIRKYDSGSGSNHQEEQKIRLATCALFLEIANADFNFSAIEREQVVSLMKEIFKLGNEEVEELIQLAEQSVKESVSIYEFTQLVNDHFDHDEKFEILKNLWRLVYVDKVLDQYEDHLMKRIGHNLKFEHKEIMAAKLIVKDELNLNGNKPES